MIKGYNNDPENRIDEEKSDRQTESGKEDVAVGTSGGYMRRYNSIGAQKHWEEKMVEEMTDRDWKIFREDHDIRVVSGKATYPLRDFNDCELNVRIVDNIRNAGYKKPTPIQMQSITMGLFRRDMIGLAPTGSGKSAAFLIPVINYLIPLLRLTQESPDEGPHAIVLSPTRELALQVQEEFEKLSQGMGFKSASLIGGHSSEQQENIINRGLDVIFGTPGRIKDILNKCLIVLDRCNYVIIDEADLMIDLGLEEDLNYILNTIPKSNLKSKIPEVAIDQETQAFKKNGSWRTTHMFSATMPPPLKAIASKYLRNECFISIGEPGEGNKNIKHEVILTNDSMKKILLMKWIGTSSDQTIVFCNTQEEVESVGRYLSSERVSFQVNKS